VANDKRDNPIEKGVKAGGETVDETVKEAGKLAGDTMTTGGKTIQSGERAVTGVAREGIRDVGKVGGEAGGVAKKAVENVAAEPKDIMDSAKTGKPKSE
jgi:hypothetical protein